jgi:hypothetical protein
VQPTTDLFSEMDQVADELRGNPQHIAGDDEIEFRQVQRLRRPDLSREEFVYLFTLWRDHYRTRAQAKESARRERVATLWQQLEALISERAALPLVTEKIAGIGREIAELCTPIEPPPSGSWG